MSRTAMKLDKRLLDAGEAISGQRLSIPEDVTLYIILTQVADREFSLKFVTESEMLTEYYTDPDLKLLNFES